MVGTRIRAESFFLGCILTAVMGLHFFCTSGFGL